MSETAAMAVPISAWHADYVHFSQLLDHLRRELDVFHSGERPDYERMCESVTPLARLEQEHRVIAQAGQALLAQIEAILGGALVPRAEMEAALATYLVYYGNHIAKEEEDVLTRAAKHLTAEDWAAVARAVPGS